MYLYAQFVVYTRKITKMSKKNLFEKKKAMFNAMDT